MYMPRFVKGIPNYPKLAPTKEIFYSDEQTYVEKYKEHLRHLSVEKVCNELEILADGRNVILLCYEKPGEFCHRHLVSEWLSSQLSYEVVEYQNPVLQENLFA